MASCEGCPEYESSSVWRSLSSPRFTVSQIRAGPAEARPLRCDGAVTITITVAVMILILLPFAPCSTMSTTRHPVVFLPPYC